MMVFSFCKAIAQDTGIVKMPVNQTDAKGKKYGMWYFSKTAARGEPATLEFGNYVQGKRSGIWYKMNRNTEDLISIETYKNGMLNGEVKYFDMGKLYCVGHYLALNPSQRYDTIVITDPVTQLESYKVLETESGSIRHGTWQYYDPETGQMIKEEEYAANDLVYKKEFDIVSRIDSSYIKRYQKNMPHNNKAIYKPPVSKRSYTE